MNLRRVKTYAMTVSPSPPPPERLREREWGGGGVYLLLLTNSILKKDQNMKGKTTTKSFFPQTTKHFFFFQSRCLVLGKATNEQLKYNDSGENARWKTKQTSLECSVRTLPWRVVSREALKGIKIPGGVVGGGIIPTASLTPSEWLYIRNSSTSV